MKYMKIKRILSWIIDFLICYYAFYIIIIYTPQRIINVYGIIDTLLSSLFFVLFFTSFCTRDLLFKNQSIGKKIFKLAIYNQYGNDIPNKFTLIKRNFISFCLNGIDIFTVLITGKTVADYIYKTKVEYKK